MTSAGRNDQIPAKKKLEWVTPKISLMKIEQCDGTGKNKSDTETPVGCPVSSVDCHGPS